MLFRVKFHVGMRDVWMLVSVTFGDVAGSAGKGILKEEGDKPLTPSSTMLKGVVRLKVVCVLLLTQAIETLTCGMLMWLF